MIIDNTNCDPKLLEQLPPWVEETLDLTETDRIANVGKFEYFDRSSGNVLSSSYNREEAVKGALSKLGVKTWA